MPADLRHKHQRMRESAFVFLRGTFYRWMQVWPDRCAALDAAPRVVGIGDLHLENFGTWRDEDGRLIWGVNDVDEACEVPYTLDLVRLATSALLAIREGHLAVSPRSACDAILDGYAAALDAGGRAFVVTSHRWLHRAVSDRLRHPKPRHYWAKLAAHPRATGHVPRKKLLQHLPDPVAPCAFLHRVAGVGSLGRPRVVALTRDGDTLVAREAKALLPSAAAWARGEHAPRLYVDRVLARAVRVPDPSFAVSRRWIIRGLAPDCARVELSDLPVEREELKLLHAMGWETANVHLGSRRRRIAKHLERAAPRWLEAAAHDMAAAVTDDFRAWTRRARRGRRP